VVPVTVVFVWEVANARFIESLKLFLLRLLVRSTLSEVIEAVNPDNSSKTLIE
jgi:hypothetical protein